MIRETTITIQGHELEKLLGVRTEYDHEEVRRGEYGKPALLSATVRQYRGIEQPYEVVSVEEAKQRIVELLRDNDILPAGKECKVTIKANHSWGSYDEDGYAPSVYSHSLTISVDSERITL